MHTRQTTYLAAMTNLSLCGLSENWLFKECGHQHWMALANLFDLNVPDFSQALVNQTDNSSIYAAFIGVSLKNAAFHLIDENDEFKITTQLVKVGLSKYYSSHTVLKDDTVVAKIEMISTLVSRSERGNNQTVFRINNTKKTVSTPENETKKHYLTDCANTLTTTSKHLKSNTSFYWNNQNITEIHANRGSAVNRFTYLPCPHSDFNGADFLYFANFQRLADQALWHFDRHSPTSTSNQLWQTENRHIAYYANINLGDTLIYQLINETEIEQKKTTRMAIFRLSDQQRIADVITQQLKIQSNQYRWANSRQNSIKCPQSA